MSAPPSGAGAALLLSNTYSHGSRQNSSSSSSSAASASSTPSTRFDNEALQPGLASSSLFIRNNTDHSSLPSSSALTLPPVLSRSLSTAARSGQYHQRQHEASSSSYFPPIGPSRSHSATPLPHLPRHHREHHHDPLTPLVSPSMAAFTPPLLTPTAADPTAVLLTTSATPSPSSSSPSSPAVRKRRESDETGPPAGPKRRLTPPGNNSVHTSHHPFSASSSQSTSPSPLGLPGSTNGERGDLLGRERAMLRHKVGTIGRASSSSTPTPPADNSRSNSAAPSPRRVSTAAAVSSRNAFRLSSIMNWENEVISDLRRVSAPHLPSAGSRVGTINGGNDDWGLLTELGPVSHAELSSVPPRPVISHSQSADSALRPVAAATTTTTPPTPTTTQPPFRPRFASHASDSHATAAPATLEETIAAAESVAAGTADSLISTSDVTMHSASDLGYSRATTPATVNENAAGAAANAAANNAAAMHAARTDAARRRASTTSVGVAGRTVGTTPTAAFGLATPGVTFTQPFPSSQQNLIRPTSAEWSFPLVSVASQHSSSDNAGRPADVDHRSTPARPSTARPSFPALGPRPAFGIARPSPLHTYTLGPTRPNPLNTMSAETSQFAPLAPIAPSRTELPLPTFVRTSTPAQVDAAAERSRARILAWRENTRDTVSPAPATTTAPQTAPIAPTRTDQGFPWEEAQFVDVPLFQRTRSPATPHEHVSNVNTPTTPSNVLGLRHDISREQLRESHERELATLVEHRDRLQGLRPLLLGRPSREGLNAATTLAPTRAATPANNDARYRPGHAWTSNERTSGENNAAATAGHDTSDGQNGLRPFLLSGDRVPAVPPTAGQRRVQQLLRNAQSSSASASASSTATQASSSGLRPLVLSPSANAAILNTTPITASSAVRTAPPVLAAPTQRHLAATETMQRFHRSRERQERLDRLLHSAAVLERELATLNTRLLAAQDPAYLADLVEPLSFDPNAEHTLLRLAEGVRQVRQPEAEVAGAEAPRSEPARADPTDIPAAPTPARVRLDLPSADAGITTAEAGMRRELRDSWQRHRYNALLYGDRADRSEATGQLPDLGQRTARTPRNTILDLHAYQRATASAAATAAPPGEEARDPVRLPPWLAQQHASRRQAHSRDALQTLFNMSQHGNAGGFHAPPFAAFHGFDTNGVLAAAAGAPTYVGSRNADAAGIVHPPAAYHLPTSAAMTTGAAMSGRTTRIVPLRHGHLRSDIPDEFKIRPGTTECERAAAVKRIAFLVLQMGLAQRRALAERTLKRVPWSEVNEDGMERDVCCSVCQDEYEPTDQIAITACKHMYHEACLITWLETPAASTCPMCRRDLASLSFLIKVTPEGANVARKLWLAAPVDVARAPVLL